jgi:hypothetical protein
MTMNDINNEIEFNKNLNKYDLYNKLIEQFSKKKVDFVMYDLFQYIHAEKEEKTKRSDQQSFREDLIKKYNKCIITGIPAKVCEACHIVPFAICDDRDKYNADNGILLRRDIHTLFDDGSLKINPNTLLVEISKEIKNDPQMKIYSDMHGMKVNIDKNTLLFLKKIY